MMNRRMLPTGLILLVSLALLPVQNRALAQTVSDRQVSKALDALKTGTIETKLRALERLEQLGPRSSPAVPTLISLLHDAAPAYRAQAALTLGRIGPEAKAAVPDLIDLLKD
ncbi:MAG: HEAT repeat domain-containing protein, partial [Isosphaeraceae bacterium]